MRRDHRVIAPRQRHGRPHGAVCRRGRVQKTPSKPSSGWRRTWAARRALAMIVVAYATWVVWAVCVTVTAAAAAVGAAVVVLEHDEEEDACVASVEGCAVDEDVGADTACAETEDEAG